MSPHHRAYRHRAGNRSCAFVPSVKLAKVELRTYPDRRIDERPYLSSRMEGGQMAKQAAITDDGFRLSDELWGQMEPLLPARPAHPLGCHRPRTPDRTAMDAIFFVLRTGCQWNALNATGICSSSSAHRRFQEWTEAGVFEAFWHAGLLAYDELEGIDWDWLAMDGAMGKAPLGGGKNRSQPDRPGQVGDEAQPAHRRRAACRWRRRGRRQPQRPQTVGETLEASRSRGPSRPPRSPSISAWTRAMTTRSRAIWPRRSGSPRICAPAARRRGQARSRQEGTALGGGAHPFLAEPLPPDPDPLGEEAGELPRHAPLRLRHHHMATCPTGIGT